MKYFCAHAKRFGKTWSANRNHHEFLDINVVICMSAPIEHVHHGHRKLVRIITTQILKQRQPVGSSPSFSYRQRYSKHSVRTQSSLVLSPIEIAQCLVYLSLVARITTNQQLSHFGVHVQHRSGHTFAEVACSVVISQLHRL